MNPLLPTALLAAGLLLFGGPDPSASSQETRTMPRTQKITPFLWFDRDAEEAIRFYTSIFPDSKTLGESRWGEGGPVPKGTLMMARFQLAGQEFMALNGGPVFHFNEAISLFVHCNTQREFDELWTKLTSGGGEPSQCGWLTDRFGLSWQVVPAWLFEKAAKNPARLDRVMAAMMPMVKLNLARLQKAYDGK